MNDHTWEMLDVLRLILFAAASPGNKKVRKWRRRFKLAALARAGLIDMRRCRKTGTEVGLYDSREAGFEADRTLPYSTVCEEHGAIVCHETLASARAAMPYPEWCDDCREIMTKKEV